MWIISGRKTKDSNLSAGKSQRPMKNVLIHNSSQESTFNTELQRSAHVKTVIMCPLKLRRCRKRNSLNETNFRFICSFLSLFQGCQISVLSMDTNKNVRFFSQLFHLEIISLEKKLRNASDSNSFDALIKNRSIFFLISENDIRSNVQGLDNLCILIWCYLSSYNCIGFIRSPTIKTA